MLKFIKNKINSILNNHNIDYPTPINFNYFWNLGFKKCLFSDISFLSKYVDMFQYLFNKKNFVNEINNQFFFLVLLFVIEILLLSNVFTLDKIVLIQLLFF